MTKKSPLSQAIDEHAYEIVHHYLKPKKPADKSGNLIVCSPLRPDTNPSFYVNERTGLWEDLANRNAETGRGDIIRMMALKWGLNEAADFKVICERIAEEVGFNLPGQEPEQPATKNPRKLVLHPLPTTEEFAQSYGLEWDDFKDAGFTLGQRAWKETEGAYIPAVSYPVEYDDGTWGQKFKSMQRATREGKTDKGKRLMVVAYGVQGATGIIGSKCLAACKNKMLVLAGGEEKMLAVRKAGYLAVTLSNGECAPSASQCRMIVAGSPSSVVVLYDNDRPGKVGAVAAATALATAGVPICRIVEWEGTRPDKFDANDLLMLEGVEGLKRRIETARVFDANDPRVKAAGPFDAKNAILLNEDFYRVVKDCIAKIAALAPNEVYRFSGNLARINAPQYAADSGLLMSRARIEPMDKHMIRVVLSRVSDFCKMDKRENLVRQALPVEICDMVLSATDEDLRDVRRIVSCEVAPVMRSDGTICTTPGYDVRSETMLYIDQSWPAVPPIITEDMMMESRDRLLDTVVDFPFKADRDKSAWLAALLTVVGRRMIQGATPAFITRANLPGVGKSWLYQTISWIKDGVDMAPKSFPPDEAEWQKIKLALAMDNAWGVLIDNLKGKIDSGQLEAALTGTSVSERLLGSNKIIQLPLNCVWLMTGNNLKLGSDLVRRAVICDLETSEEFPARRDKFVHDPLPDWVKKSRKRLYVDALILLAYGKQCERVPTPMLKPRFGSFESWSEVVRKTIVHCQLTDPLDRTNETDDDMEDGDRQTIYAFHNAIKWLESEYPAGVTATVICNRSLHAADNDNDVDTPIKTLGQLIAMLPGQRRGSTFPPSAIQLRLEGWEGRVVKGRKLRRTMRDGTPVWNIVSVSDEDPGTPF